MLSLIATYGLEGFIDGIKKILVKFLEFIVLIMNTQSRV